MNSLVAGLCQHLFIHVDKYFPSENEMRSIIVTGGFVILTVASILSLLIKTNLTAYAVVICVDKNNPTKVLPCSDSNAVDKNSIKTSQTNNNTTTSTTPKN